MLVMNLLRVYVYMMLQLLLFIQAKYILYRGITDFRLQVVFCHSVQGIIACIYAAREEKQSGAQQL